jgi:hypothetical protein
MSRLRAEASRCAAGDDDGPARWHGAVVGRSVFEREGGAALPEPPRARTDQSFWVVRSGRCSTVWPSAMSELVTTVPPVDVSWPPSVRTV